MDADMMGAVNDIGDKMDKLGDAAPKPPGEEPPKPPEGGEGTDIESAYDSVASDPEYADKVKACESAAGGRDGMLRILKAINQFLEGDDMKGSVKGFMSGVNMSNPPKSAPDLLSYIPSKKK